MDSSTVKNPFDDITCEEVYEEARLQGAIERIFEDIRSCINNSESYKTLVEAAQQNILGDHFVKSPDIDVQSKKKRLQEIALLASQFDSTITEFFTATKDIEGKPVIEKIIKQLSYLKRESASKVVSPSKKGQTENNNSENANDRQEKQPTTSKNICYVNKAYKSMVEEEKKTPIKRQRVKSTSKACASIASKDSDETDALPKRQRKPNSRYISK